MKNVSKRTKMILAIVGILGVVVIAVGVVMTQAPSTNALFGAAVPTATPRTVTPGPSPTNPPVIGGGATATNTPTRTNTPPPPTATRTNTPAPTATPPIDMSFNPGAIGAYVRAIAVQADGKILVGGNFDTLSEESTNLPTDIAFLLLSKCVPVRHYFNVGMHDLILFNGR